jgi:hypothetical protein
MIDKYVAQLGYDQRFRVKWKWGKILWVSVMRKCDSGESEQQKG